MIRYCAGLLAVLAATFIAVSPALALDKLKLAIGQRGVWENAAPEVGQLAPNGGFFKQRGLELEILYTQGGGETQQAVISGAIDIGIGAGLGGAMGAFAKGAPVRVFANAMTGANDLFWYVPAASPLKSMKEAGGKTIAFSTRGSSTNIIVLAFMKHFGIAAKPTATGSPAATYTQAMTGQVDVGWGAAPFGMADLAEGKIRILARGSDVPSIQKQTVRVQITNADVLAKRADALARFVAAWNDTLEWMYTDDGAKAYAGWMQLPVPQVLRTREEFYPKANQDPYTITGLDQAMADAVEHKFIAAPLTKAQSDELFRLQQRAK